jgi:NHLM bacteriocin system ABC transporter peptidase/ATP-binding protein
MEAVECGAASLAIILAYYGKFVALAQLRIDTGVSRDGTKASNVLSAARNYGLIAKGFKKTPETIKAMRMPVIVFWNFCHFLVVEGFSEKKVYLNDPGAGPRAVTYEEFDQAFTGVVLAMEPGPEFRKGGARKGLLTALGARLKGSRTALSYAALSGIALVVPGIVIPVFSKVFVDNILLAHMEDWLRPLLLGMGITAALRGAITWLRQHYLLKLQTAIATETSAGFFRHVLQLPVVFFTQRSGAEISHRVGLNDEVAALLSGDLADHFLNLVTALFFALIMLAIQPGLTCIGILAASLNMLALRVIARKREDGNQRLLQERGKLIGTVMSGIMGIETIKAGGTESDFFAKWGGHQAKVMSGEQELNVTTQTLNAVPALLSMLNTALILCIGSVKVMNGNMTVGTLVAYQSLMSSFMQPVNMLVGLGARLQEMKGNMNRLDDVLGYASDPIFNLDHASRRISHACSPYSSEGGACLTGRLEFRNVTFGYSRLEPPLIEGFNLELTPGKRVALIGASGSGKSTIAKLVSGLYAPWSGEILFDGMTRHEVPREIMLGSFAYVDQDIFLFQGTVRENLNLWDGTLPETSVIQAAKDATIHDDIVARAGGYNAVVEEGGRNFSGGQRQRMEIARALAGNPSIVVLDEAMSALDPATEKEVDDNIRRRGCTCLIVAHRLSTIRDCDEILVLETGKVVQRGSHNKLKDMDGPYAGMIKNE